MDFSATVGGQDISSHIMGIYRDHSLCEGMATIELKLDPAWGESPAFSPYDEIVIEEEGTGVYKGYVIPIDKQRMDPVRTIMGQDCTKKIMDTWLTDWETNGSMTPVDALADLFEESGLTVSQYNFRDSTTDLLPDKEWANTSAWDILEEVLTMMGWQIWSDGDGVLQVGQIMMPAPTHTFQAGDNLISVMRRRDDSYTRTAIAVYGSDNVSVKKTAAAPVLNSMERAGAFANPLIHTEALADEIATRALIEFNQILDVKTCEIVGDPTVRVADGATVIEDFCGLNHNCLITGVRSTMDATGYHMTVSLDERCPDIWGFGETAGSIWLYAATAGSGVYLSTTYGDRWAAANGSGGSALTGSALYVYAVEANINNQSDVWAGTADGLYRSLSAGGAWSKQDMGTLVDWSGGSYGSEATVHVVSIDQDELDPGRVYFLVNIYSSGSIGAFWEGWVVSHSDSGGSWAQWEIQY